MTKEELKERQSWSLDQKIDHSLGVIEQFYNRLNGGAYVSFSGGKDSTVLLWLARRLYPDIKAVFCNTGNEYPDIVRFVRELKENGANIDIIQPDIKPRQVIEQIGFPLISKDKAEQMWYIKNKPDTEMARKAFSNDRFKRMPLCYRYMIDEPYQISAECCHILKKKPMHEYALTHGVSPILGTMAEESKTREIAYLRRGGCNVFNNRDKRKQSSTPLAIWTEKDVYECIDRFNIKIADIYHKGAQRTGCMFCLFGAQCNNAHGLYLLYNLYPKWYHTFMEYTNNGVTYREAARKFLATHNITLPDEQPNDLFNQT